MVAAAVAPASRVVALQSTVAAVAAATTRVVASWRTVALAAGVAAPGSTVVLVASLVLGRLAIVATPTGRCPGVAAVVAGGQGELTKKKQTKIFSLYKFN